jgi:hypothetical protein
MIPPMAGFIKPEALSSVTLGGGGTRRMPEVQESRKAVKSNAAKTGKILLILTTAGKLHYRTI